MMHHPLLEHLRDFASDLQQMNVIPFSGMKVVLGIPCGDLLFECTESPTELDPVFNDILERLPWKHFSVKFGMAWYKYETCRGFLFVKKVLEKFGSVLEEFSLWLPSEQYGFIEQVLRDDSLSNLKALSLEDVSGTFDEDYTDLIKELVSRAPNLKALCTRGRVDLRGNLLEGSSAKHVTDYPFLAEMFPNIGRLLIQANDEIPCGSIWDSWPNLRELDVGMEYSTNGRLNFDCGFCGIFPEEVAHLREQDEEYLRSVHIVPVMPSVTCLKGLRILTVHYGGSYSDGEPGHDSTLIFSKVTALIAFQRCPTLTFNLLTSNERHEQELSHLKPYATVRVVSNDDDDYWDLSHWI